MIPGIPNKELKRSIPTITQKQQAEFVIQEHQAARAGKHYDVRLGINGVGYSWAGRYLPNVGEKVLMTRQPDHTIEYFDFQGEIPGGYGKGSVRTFVRDKVEVIESSPTKITFYHYPGTQTIKYSLVNTNGDQWVFLNHTISKEIENQLSSVTPLKYKDMTGRYFPKPQDVYTPKIDGASSITILKPGKTPVVYSKRISKRHGLPIEYTPKIESLLNYKPPLGTGTNILRTEVFAATPTHEEVPNRMLGGMLNANVWKSRELQKQNKTPLQIATYDIAKYKGRDVSHLPYAQRLELIEGLKSVYPIIKTPMDYAKKINFPEGQVVWRNGQPLKVKNRPDYDVYVKKIFPAVLSKGGTPRAGGIEYSLTPKGPIVGRVGTGWTHEELQDMYNNPQKYVGKAARIYTLGQHPSGALRAPAFANWHLEKGKR